MNILFIGPNSISSKHKFITLKKIYKNVDIIDGYKAFVLNKVSQKIFWHISSKIFAPMINNFILGKINKFYDLIFVDSGELIGEELIINLKKKTKKIVYYCNDNPFVSRDKQRWKLSLGSLKYYDLVVFHNQSRIKPSKKYGVKRHLLVLPSYQKKVHCPQKLPVNLKKKYIHEVIFIGTWEKERGVFFKKIIELGLNIKIYGTGWEKDKNYSFLKQYIKLGHIKDPYYSRLIYCSKIAICLTNVGNRDNITKRSIEIPAIGTLMCANKTAAHKKIFVENKEAVFFNNVNECYKKCNKLLSDSKKIKRIAKLGHIKVTKTLKTDFETVIKKIVKKTFGK